MAKHNEHRFRNLMHFAGDIFSHDKIERMSRVDPVTDGPEPASEKIKTIVSRYIDMEFDTITPRSQAEIDQEISDTIPEMVKELQSKPEEHFKGENGMITE
jgi:hypothetical protein